MDLSALKEQIERILRSQSFASKSQLKKLLEVLSQNFTSQDALSPDLVIRELWPGEIKTKRPADVATEMNRLRRALETYYEGEGDPDPVVVFLPNRAAPAPDGTPEKRWIAARPRGQNGEPPLRAQTEGRPFLKGKVAIAAIGAVGVVAALLAIRLLALHGEPRFGRLDGSSLTILNAEGKELWRKDFPEGFALDRYYENGGVASRIWFGDLEGQGHTSVLFLYLPATSPQSHSSTLICYSDRGTERWRWTPGKDLPELHGTPATYWTLALAVLKATDKRPPRIVLSSAHDTWWPNQIAVLDSNGSLLSEYWHSGNLEYLTLADLDGDGREEIIATGISNGYHQATLLVLDPDRVSGASTEAARPELQIHGMGAAAERLRLLFPRSDMNKALYAYNVSAEAAAQHGELRVSVRECPYTKSCLIVYEFDKSGRLITAYASDQFRAAHADFYSKGKEAHPFSAEEEAEFRKVRCLVGCKTEFVPTGN